MPGYSVTYTVVDNATKQIDAINKRIAQMRAPLERQARTMQRFMDVSGLRKIADGFNWIARAAGSALRVLSSVVPVVGVLTSAATIGGMVKLVSSFAAWGNQLRTNADQIGINTSELQRFQDATMRAGGNAEDMTETLKNLHQISAGAFTGMNNEALSYFNRFNIALSDANGNLRTSTDLLPEVFTALDGLKDPYDRSRVAAALLGDAQAKLYEEYKQSGQSLQTWLRQEQAHLRLTDAQLESLNQYRLAVAGLETDFSQLGRQVGATLADDFTPLVQEFDKWVQNNQPQILAAVKEVGDEFRDWLKGVDWAGVRENISAVTSLLRAMLEVLKAIGAAINDTAFLFGLKNRKFTKEDVLTNSPFYSQLTPEQQRMVRAQVGVSDADLQAQPGVSFWNSPGTWLGNRLFRGGRGNEGYTPPQGNGAQSLWDRAMRGPESIQPQSFQPTAPDLTPEGRALLSTIAGHESRGDYSVLYGGGHFTGNQFPTWAGRDNSHAAGAYQFQPGTFSDVQRATGISDFSPANQDRAAWYLAQRDYHTRTGRDLTVDLHDPSKAADIARTLQPTWTSTNAPGWAAELQHNLAQAPAAAPPPPAAPNGAVDVSITHRNPPPDAAVTATGSGAVNVAPPRVEHPQVDMAAAS